LIHPFDHLDHPRHVLREFHHFIDQIILLFRIRVGDAADPRLATFVLDRHQAQRCEIARKVFETLLFAEQVKCFVKFPGYAECDLSGAHTTQV
jgi:hypothetical protein